MCSVILLGELVNDDCTNDGIPGKYGSQKLKMHCASKDIIIASDLCW